MSTNFWAFWRNRTKENYLLEHFHVCSLILFRPFWHPLKVVLPHHSFSFLFSFNIWSLIYCENPSIVSLYGINLKLIDYITDICLLKILKESCICSLDAQKKIELLTFKIFFRLWITEMLCNICLIYVYFLQSILSACKHTFHLLHNFLEKNRNDQWLLLLMFTNIICNL